MITVAIRKGKRRCRTDQSGEVAASGGRHMRSVPDNDGQDVSHQAQDDEDGAHHC